MKTIGIICEYNPFHLGHLAHINKSKQALSEDLDETAVIGVMSGNFVQRGDFAIFNKHSRAKTAVKNGVDLVIELPTPYVLQSAEGFAAAGVFILDSLGICDYLSFGSESGDILPLTEAAKVIATAKADNITKLWLKNGITYAAAQQKAAEELMGEKAGIFKSPNNVLGIEYIKALNAYKSSIKPLTIKRTGGEHDSDTGYSASALRKVFYNGQIPSEMMPHSAVADAITELLAGRGAVSVKNAETAIISRLRNIDDYGKTAGISEGLEKRFKRFASTEPTISSILQNIKTKRYTMARLRRILLCAVLGITKDYTQTPPAYIRILAMNEKGQNLLNKAKKKSKLPILTKPAAIYKLSDSAINLFTLEAKATDLYTLAYTSDTEKKGSLEWKTSPIVL